MIADWSMLLRIGDERGELVLEKVLGGGEGWQHVCCKVSKMTVLKSLLSCVHQFI